MRPQTASCDPLEGEGDVGMGQDSGDKQGLANQPNIRPANGAALFISRGTSTQRERQIESSVFTIGSGQDCDLILGDEQFPELYAYILQGPDGFRVRCLADEPVLTINAEDAGAAKLEDGDRIRCGPYEFRFHDMVASPVRPAEASEKQFPSGAKHWIATDGQARDGIAASRRLLRDIQLRIDGANQSTQVHRRSA